MVSQLRELGRYAKGLREFLRTPLPEAECLDRLRRGLAGRESSFLDVIERGVFAEPASPYRKLFEHAGIEPGDLRALVESEGVDGAAEKLYEAGVYVTLEEFRGERAIVRPGLSVSVRASDFDNPLATPVWRASTGGSRSLGRQILLNFDHLESSALYYGLFLAAHRAVERPAAIWRPLPSATGLNNALRSVKVGRPIEKWFSQTAVGERPYPLQGAALTAYVLLACRLWAQPLPVPEHVSFSGAVRIARWLEAKARAGTPAHLGAPVGSAVRVCLAAQEHGLDIAGTLFRLGGEPLTGARADAISATGSDAFADYSMAEVGRVGVSCAAPSAVGDVHFLLDKLVFIQRPRVVPGSGESVHALFYTTLLPSAPKLMVNVETDDYAVVEDRSCGCLIGELGFSRHLHGIRSYEKLTSEGMTLRGADAIELLEHTLPTRFGGAPTDYQLVEEVDEALPALSVVVSPRVRGVDERQVIETVLAALARGNPGQQDVSRIWRDGRTLRVVRREPYATSGAKILPIHVQARPQPSPRRRDASE